MGRGMLMKRGARTMKVTAKSLEFDKVLHIMSGFVYGWPK